ncbi:MFS transporter [Erythrobacter mangrovi]|uniref:MFS transporter n=1 Tax=Erythrobacter mangrovi TaxID=2739433 RepID=A0A7D4BC68_9SPHN|nr:MFS transporter [Erythrobacter mangrovi]QKG72481.1 MFS transporter [Erythrobacter mangrovi]
MTATEAGLGAQRQSLSFLWLYALAAAGGAVAYVPFLTVLLPERVTGFAGSSGVAVLAYTAFAGAIAASFANIGFGWLSDRTGLRRPWIFGGVVLSGFLLVAMARVDSLVDLIPMIIAWQLALNMMLGPLAAWAGDVVPDAQKGLLGGLLSLAPALGALSGALVTWPGLASPDARLTLVALIVAAMVLPVLIFGHPRPMPSLMEEAPPVQDPLLVERAPVARMWLARLLVQVAEAALFAFLLFWFRSIDRNVTDNDTAAVFSIVLCVSVPLALAAGRWSDRNNRPVLPLTIGAGLGSLGLLAMATAQTLLTAIGSYILFGLATSVFLALHSSQTLRVLPRPRTRGRDLGFFNLTNTVPSLIMPWLTLALVPVFGFDALFLLLAALAAAACLILLSMRRI